jgi:hypothetical protein
VRGYDKITVDPVSASGQYFDSHYFRGSKFWWRMAEGENYLLYLCSCVFALYGCRVIKCYAVGTSQLIVHTKCNFPSFYEYACSR